MKPRICLRSSTRLLGATLLIALFVLSASAQQGTSTVRGTVIDQNKNVVPGATVTLTNTGTGATRTATTSDAGVYAFDFVAVGDYKIEVEAAGFKKTAVTDIHALIAQSSTVDVVLDVGTVTEVVTVAASATEVMVNRDDGTLGNTFVTKQITQLPLEGRNVTNLLSLQPGATRDGFVAGARADQSNITLDGVDINEAETNQTTNPNTDPADSTNALNLVPDRSTVLRLNAEAVEEFRVTTTNANANQGRSGGAQVALVTKSGSNEFHGALFEFYRTKKFSANNFFNNKAGIEKPALIRHTFGGALGGPIIKDRAFFFYSFEGDRITRSQPIEAPRNVPLASLGRGEVRYFGCNPGTNPEDCGDSVPVTLQTLTTAQLTSIFPAVGINPAAVAVLRDAAAKYPANDFSVGDGLNSAGFRFNTPLPASRNSHVGKFDFNLTEKQTAFVRTSVIYDLLTQERQFPDTAAPTIWSHPFGLAVGHTWTITNSMVNNFRYGFTREAFSQQGDSGDNAISFRFIFSPLTFSRTLTRITPVQNFTNDLSWVKGNHSFGFGTNIRLVRNRRDSFANAFDNAITNPSFFQGGGATIAGPVNNFAPISGATTGVENAVTALIGRFSQYSALFTFDRDGTLLPSGTPAAREFRTEEYDLYFQDAWKLTPNLTITYGLRYGISTPVYEKNGFEVKTTVPLGDFFDARRESAARGIPLNDPLTLELSGKANNAAPLYDYDKNNFQPRIGVAWSPSFKTGFLSKVFGRNNQSVIRGGFAVTNDYYGQQLAVTFDLGNTLGFSSSQDIAANTFNLTTRLAPLFTGFGQNVRGLPRINDPGNITFPRTQPFEPFPAGFAQDRRIETSLDSRLVAPINYSWNVTYERQLPKGLVIQTSYIGRLGRNLIASRDTMALNNLVDPGSGMDWYTAGGILETLRAAGTSTASVQQLAYFANILPGNIAALMNLNYFGNPWLGPDLGCTFPDDYCVPENLNQTQAVYDVALNFYGNDWTDTQDVIEQGLDRNIFFHPQYGALSTHSSIARSNYHAGTLSVRQRLGRSFTADFNYTLSHSHDDASGLQTAAQFGGAFIHNPLRQKDSYAESDFDVRHIINANSVWDMPFGRGRTFFSGISRLADAFVGGWQMTGIFRWNSGLPLTAPFDNARWATNWNAQSNTVRTRDIEPCPVRGGRIFDCNLLEFYRSLRNPFPGETGDRNVFRLAGYVNLDMGLTKNFNLPWNENHRLQLRVEAFNVTNTQRMNAPDTGSRTGWGVGLDPSTFELDDIPVNFGRFTGIQGAPRVMQFGIRYSF
ncbi:MAG TPA: TonB-dependent receptor [Pyrinomonadaceae bacterium]|nr:TonB-dependent receptor [Pyrinomonadaceae bacterium]